jgi:hypothetical protein
LLPSPVSLFVVLLCASAYFLADFFHDTYGFGPGIGGLVYLGLGGGFIVATLFCAHWADQIYQHVCIHSSSPSFSDISHWQLANKNGGVGKPEMRIPALIAGAFVVPVGLLYARLPVAMRLTLTNSFSWYGWSAAAKLHYMMPIIGCAIYGFGASQYFCLCLVYNDLTRCRHDDHLVRRMLPSLV